MDMELFVDKQWVVEAVLELVLLLLKLNSFLIKKKIKNLPRIIIGAGGGGVGGCNHRTIIFCL